MGKTGWDRDADCLVDETECLAAPTGSGTWKSV